MTKRVFFVFTVLLFTVSAFCNEIALPHVNFFDEQGAVQDISAKCKIHFYDRLESSFYTELLTFVKTDDSLKVESIYDAEKVCAIKNCRYLVYGFLQVKENFLFSNFKFYDSLQNKILWEVFDAGNSDEKEKVLENSADKISEKLRLYFNLKDSSKAARNPYWKLQVPLNFFYWSPADRKWMDVVNGTGGVELGLGITQVNVKAPVRKSKVLFSEAFLAEYKFGYGDNKYFYDQWHSIVVKNMLRLNFESWTGKCLYFGAGPFYEFDLLLFKEKKASPVIYRQKQWGVTGETGLGFRITDGFKMNFGIQGDFPLTDESFISVKSMIGFVFSRKTPYGKKK